jgi:transposase
MPDASVVKLIREKYTALISDLDERGRRRWAATEARALGRGGIAAVAQATGISDRTIRNGISELSDPQSLTVDLQRRPCGGRLSREDEQPQLLQALQGLVDDSTRGDPMSPLRWTCKSTRVLAVELNRQGYQISSTKVGELLRAQGYSLQGNRKTVEGKQHPDRDAQFQHIASRVRAFQRTGQPVISVDTKKKEPLGNMKNAGKTYRKKGDPVRVTTHDFPDKQLGKAVPYGVYDVTHNEAGVSVGISHDTAEFAIAAIRRWWKRMGKKRYGKAKRLLITADCGGSNSPRTRLWRWTLQRFANETGMKIELCHYPPGTSKWNKIEHRLFCHIARNWQGVPLESYEVVVNLIGSTKTTTGLEVHAWLDESEYEKSKKVSDDQLAEVIIKRDAFHGEWNYQIIPSTR